MATSSFSKTFEIKTDEAAENIIKGMEARRRTPAVVSPITCKIASKEMLAKKGGLQ